MTDEAVEEEEGAADTVGFVVGGPGVEVGMLEKIGPGKGPELEVGMACGGQGATGDEKECAQDTRAEAEGSPGVQGSGKELTAVTGGATAAASPHG